MSTDSGYMQRALALARKGEGFVEPNPLVGCVIVREGEIVGEGFHGRFGGPHAEVEALHVAGDRAAGATAYVTLEPCCHYGKTPPCTDALIAAGIARVVAAQTDPFPAVAGNGFAKLKAAGIEVVVGVEEAAARVLNAPFRKLVETGRPWVIAKWAMSLDGKIATRMGDSRWISGEASRAVVHRLRGRVDAILVGRGTVERDDPLLTARPPGPRVATRIVLDSRASLRLDSQLVRTAATAPVLVVASPHADDSACDRLRSAGCEVLKCPDLPALLDELGRRRMTNVLVEGGSRVIGSFFDARLIDEVHVFIAPRLIGGDAAPSPIAGRGVEAMNAVAMLAGVQIERLGDDVWVRGRL